MFPFCANEIAWHPPPVDEFFYVGAYRAEADNSPNE